MADGYTPNKWNGLDNYQCNSCEFATLDEDEMKKHVKFHKQTDKKQTEAKDETATTTPTTPSLGGKESAGGGVR